MVVRTRREPADGIDRLGRGTARLIHRAVDQWFGCRRTHRMLVIEALAGVPAAATALRHHLRALRAMRLDALVRTSIEQAEREQAHLLVFASFATPTRGERALIAVAQAIFLFAYGLYSLVTDRGAQRLAGYFEEEALDSYDDYLAAIVRGDVDDVVVPAWAAERWSLEAGARLSALVPHIQQDEAEHRDEHHAAADALLVPSGARAP